MEGQGVTGTGGASATTVARRALRHLPFADTYDLKAEGNGRIVLPSAFRPAFAQGGYLRVHQGQCLGLWTAHDFVEQVDRPLARRRQPNLTPGDARKVLYATSKAIKPDAQGRIIVPEELRSAVGIDTDLVVVGAAERLELWAPDRWATSLADAASILDLELLTFDEVDADEIPEVPDLGDGEA